MQAINAYAQPEPATSTAVPATPSVWTSAHHFHRIPDPASFAWLNALSTKNVGTSAEISRCFGMDVIYLALDLLHWFPNEIVLAIPFLVAPPPEYFLVCNEGGKRWWCFVVLRRGSTPTALVFDVSPSVLLVNGLGLRETHVDTKTGAVSRGRDFDYRPNAAVLCPMDLTPIRHEWLSPATREYFCISEAGGQRSGSRLRALADVMGMQEPPPAISALEVSIGTPALGLRMRVNEDDSLMRYLDSLADGEGGAA